MFGMGTGGTSSLLPPDFSGICYTFKTKQCINFDSSLLPLPILPWSSPRSISTGQLNTLLHLHLRPINHVVFMGPYYLKVWEILS